MKETSAGATRASWRSTSISSHAGILPGITGVEYAPGESRFRIGDLIGVTLRGVPKDDGVSLLLFLHELNESGREYAILLGDLDLDLDLDLA